MTIQIYTDNGDMTAKLYGQTANKFFSSIIGKTITKEYMNQHKEKKVKYIITEHLKQPYDLFYQPFLGQQQEVIKLDIMLYKNYFFCIEP